MSQIGPTTGEHVGYSEKVILKASEVLQKAGNVGLHWRDLLALTNQSDKDEGAGYLSRALREHGFLVQREGGWISIQSHVSCYVGAWMRHPVYGVVKVVYARSGFDFVKVQPLGGGAGKAVGDTIKVARADLSGQ